MSKMTKGEKLVLRTMTVDAGTYLGDASLKGVPLWSRTPKRVVKAAVAIEEEEKRQAKLAQYIAQGYAFEAPQQEEMEDENEYAVEV